MDDYLGGVVADGLKLFNLRPVGSKESGIQKRIYTSDSITEEQSHDSDLNHPMTARPA